MIPDFLIGPVVVAAIVMLVIWGALYLICRFFDD